MNCEQFTGPMSAEKRTLLQTACDMQRSGSKLAREGKYDQAIVAYVNIFRKSTTQKLFFISDIMFVWQVPPGARFNGSIIGTAVFRRCSELLRYWLLLL
jgi:hypothetical protein